MSTDKYTQLFGKDHIKDGDVIGYSEHGRVGGLSTGQGFKFTSAVNPIDSDPLIADALNRILADYGDTVSVKNKAKSLLKFGRNTNVGSVSTGYTIWWTGQDQTHETYVADNINSIDTLSSSSGSDTMQVTVEGHTMTGGNRTFVTQNKTLVGQGKATLDTPLNRLTRIYVSGGTSNNVGEIYGYEDTSLTSGKPTDTTKIHITVPVGKNQSEKASTSLSSTDYWIITNFEGSLVEKTSSFADIELQVREVGSVFRPRNDVVADGSGGSYNFKPYLIIPPNADVRLIAVSDSTSREVSGSIQGFLAN